jgi:protein TonB
MFEDSTFESAGKIRTRSRRWMIAAFTFNASILLAFVLTPLLYLEALPPQTILTGITVPPAPHVQEQQPKQLPQSHQTDTEMDHGHLLAPPKIPHLPYIARDPEPRPLTIGPDDPFSTQGGRDNSNAPQLAQVRPHIIHAPQANTMRVSTMVAEGLLIHKVIPTYPPIAIAAHVQGTVVLAASISKGGAIEKLRVVSGPPVLQQAAVDAVSTWHYKPYMLDGEPVEVETTVNVVFSLGR